MANADDANDPRLKQDKFERKDKENSNAGMVGGVIIVILGLVCLYLLYYFYAPQNKVPVTPTVVATPNAENPSANQASTTTTAQ